MGSHLTVIPVFDTQSSSPGGPTSLPQAERLGFSVVRKVPFDAVQRPDRPLLIDARVKKFEAMHWDCLGAIREMSDLLSPAEMKNLVGGDVSVEADALSKGSQSVIRNAFDGGFPGTDRGEIPANARVRASAKYHLRFVEKGGEEHILVLNDQSSASPFDPDKYKRLFTSDPGQEMPEKLRQTLGGSRIALPKPGSSLGNIVASVHVPHVDLFVDRRAVDWRVLLHRPKEVSVPSLLESIAVAHRLYWRRVGESWLLAASPYNPRLFAIDLARAQGRRDLFETLAPLARSGALREDLFALIATEDGRAFGQWDSQQQAFVQGLLDHSEAITDKSDLQKFLASRSRVSDCRVQITFDTSMSVRWNGNSLTVGIMNP